MPATVDEIVSIDAPKRGRLDEPHDTRAPDEGVRTTVSEAKSLPGLRNAPWNPERFAQEQIRALIQRVFFPGWPQASRQVVISGAEAQTDSAHVCTRIVREMATALPGTVCAVEANPYCAGMVESMRPPLIDRKEPWRDGSIAVADNLWLVTPESVLGKHEDGLNAVWIRARLSELRRNFDYTLIHAPAAFLTETVLLGRLADGLILIVQARHTHRAVAQKSLEILQAAKVQVLGTILTDRTFPIPEALYCKL